MSQRSQGNDRYRKGAKVGSTRKSAAAAKPVRKQGAGVSSVSKPKADTPKKDAYEKDWAGLPTNPKIKMWRRVWWVLLGSGLALIASTYYIPEIGSDEGLGQIIAIAVVVLSGIAIYLDLVVIRKLRQTLMAEVGYTPPKREPKKKGKDAS